MTNEDKKEKTTDTDKNLSNITDKAKDQHDEDINGENQEKDHQEPEEDDESPKDNTYEAKNDDTQEKDPQELENVDVKKPEEQHPEAVNDDSQEKDHEELEDKDEEKPEDQDPEAVKDDKQEKDQELEEEEEECSEEGEESFEEDTLGQEDPSLQMAGVLEVHPSEDVDTVNILLCIADPWCKLITVGEKTWEIRSKQTHKRALPSLRFFHMFQSRCCYFHLRFGLPYTSELGQETSANWRKNKDRKVLFKEETKMEQFNQLFIGTCTWVFLAKALQSYGSKSANSGGRIGVWRKGSNSVIGSVEIIDCKEFDKASSKATFSKHRIPPSELLACLFFSTHVFRCTYKYIYI